VVVNAGRPLIDAVTVAVVAAGMVVGGV